MPDTNQAQNVEELISILRNNTIFTELSDAQVEQFANRATFSFYEQGKQVTQQGVKDERFFVVLSGQLRVVDMSDPDQPRLLNYHSAKVNPILGLRALLEDGTRAATVEVVSDARLAIYNKKDWDWLIDQNSRIIDYFKNLERQFERQSLTDFPGRQWDEVVVASTKRHPLALFANLTVSLVLLIIPIIFLLIAELFGLTFLSIITDNFIFTILFIVPFVVLAILLATYYYLDWRNDDFIVTTKRVIHIERILFYGEERREAPLTRIENVTVKSEGIIDLIFDCDDIEIKTAGVGFITIDNIANAEQLQQIILQEQERAKSRVVASDIASVRQFVAKRLDWKDRLPQNVLEVAESEGRITTHKPTRRLPVILGLNLDYIWPRIKDSKDIKIGKRSESAVIWRKHYFILLQNVFLPILTFLISFYLLTASFLLWPPFTSPASGLLRGLLFLFLIASILWYGWEYDDWGKDIYIAAETRIIDVEGSPFNVYGELRREGSFDTIQNISYTIPNFFFKLLNLGDVVIETASQEGVFTFKKVLNPSSVQAEIFNRWAIFQQQQREKSRDSSTEQIVKVLGEYHDLATK